MILTITSRRTVLGSITSIGLAVVSGCLGSVHSNGEGDGQSNPFTQVTVEGVDLVVEISPEAPVDQVAVIAPSGERFAEQSISPGVTRKSVRLGTDYDPGEYEIRGLVEGETAGKTTIEIRPNVQITDLKLAQNHPDEMYEGAERLAIGAEAIVTVRNQGSGPASIVALRFDGDVPQPSPKNYEKSGIYDVESDIRKNVEEVVLPPHEDIILYSTSRPFSPTGDNISCSPSTAEGKFEVLVRTQSGDFASRIYSVTYTGSGLFGCQINKTEV